MGGESRRSSSNPLDATCSILSQQAEKKRVPDPVGHKPVPVSDDWLDTPFFGLRVCEGVRVCVPAQILVSTFAGILNAHLALGAKKRGELGRPPSTIQRRV